MFKKITFYCTFLLFVFSLSCQSVPITGRSQLNIVPIPVINSLSLTSYKDFLSKHSLSNDTQETQMVKRVGSNIQKAVEQYFTQNNMSSYLKDYSWEFNLVVDPAINAWCLPGGKVVVYTGILPVTKDEQGLAVVIGHEIAHAIANHGNERMSQALLTQMGGVALSTALSDNSKETRNLFLNLYGMGSQVGILLPYSRLQENESDHLGLIYMAMAGYDPHAAVSFWQRMATSNKKPSPPTYLSTHPTHEARIQNIRKLIPEVMKYYRNNPFNSP